jgi:hypothetical protein
VLTDRDPVLIFEQIGLYGVSGEIDEDAGPVDSARPCSR